MESRPLTIDEFYNELITKNSGKNSLFKERDRLLLGLSVMCGLREIELTQLTIGLVISPTNELNEFVELPNSITYDGYDRPFLLSNEEIQGWFVDYIKWLVSNGINTQAGNSYYGLNPNAQLFVNDDFKPFSAQKRGNGNLSPVQLNKHLDKLIKNTALWARGIRRKSFIRTCTIQSYRAGMSTNDITVTTGQGEETIKNTLVMDLAQYDPICDWFDQRKVKKAKRLESFKKRRKYMI